MPAGGGERRRGQRGRRPHRAAGAPTASDERRPCPASRWRPGGAGRVSRRRRSAAPRRRAPRPAAATAEPTADPSARCRRTGFGGGGSAWRRTLARTPDRIGSPHRGTLRALVGIVPDEPQRHQQPGHRERHARQHVRRVVRAPVQPRERHVHRPAPPPAARTSHRHQAWVPRSTSAATAPYRQTAAAVCPDGKLDVGGRVASRWATGGRGLPTTAVAARKISTSPTSTGDDHERGPQPAGDDVGEHAATAPPPTTTPVLPSSANGPEIASSAGTRCSASHAHHADVPAQERGAGIEVHEHQADADHRPEQQHRGDQQLRDRRPGVRRCVLGGVRRGEVVRDLRGEAVDGGRDGNPSWRRQARKA